MSEEPKAPMTRTQRQRARLARPVPERDVRYSELDLDGLRSMRLALADEELRISYWRRILQARLDVVRSEQQGAVDVADLSRILADAPNAHRRLANMTLARVDDVPPLPDLAELWAREVDPEDKAGVSELESELAAAERDLSDHRRRLHEAIDAVTAELIARYREDPSLALGALPTNQHRSAG